MNLPLDHIWQSSRQNSRNLVVVLHGRGDSAEGFTWLQEELALDALNFLLLTAPEPYYTGYSWYPSSPSRRAGVLKSRLLLTQAFDSLALQGFAPDRTFLLGFSQGCLITLEFGSRYTQRLAGYVGISGYCDDPGAILRDLNPAVNAGDWLVTHGTQDEMLPVERTRSQIRLLNEGGFKIDYREFRKTHTVDIDDELPQIREWMRARIREG